VRLAYVATVAVFLWAVGQCYIPGKGFTYLVMFGDANDTRALPELHAIDHHIMPRTVGYDGQFYAQIAMHPRLADPALRRAVDNLPYRARRILFSWTATALGLGDPVRVLEVYALQGVAAWLLLVWLLLRWFPADSWQNFLRWSGVLLSLGMCYSVRGAVPDGPSLLLIAGGVALTEAGRPWLSAFVLGVGGLGKETNVLAGALLLPARGRDRRAWRDTFVRGAIVVAPVALWLVTLTRWIGRGPNAGVRNFDWPFAGFVHQWSAAWAQLHQPVWKFGAWSLLVLVALAVQWLWLALRPQWHSPWWRVGAAYALLMAILGDAVWESFPGAACRVLLPMVVAFNVLVPRAGWRAWVVLIAGNLTVLLAPTQLPPPFWDAVSVEGSRALRTTPDGGRSMTVTFGEHWFAPEQSLFERWRWSDGAAAVTVRNPQRFAVRAELACRLRARDARRVSVRVGGRTLTTTELTPGTPVDLRVPDVRLAPGETVITFDTDRPAPVPTNPLARHVAFNVRDLTLTVVAPADH
jgi:hypothetical protein